MDKHGVGRVLLLRVGGALDGSLPAPDQVAASARAAGARFVLLDATGASYADSDGLRWLLRVREMLEGSGKRLRIAARRGGKVWRNLALLDARLEMYGSVGGAWKEAWCFTAREPERKP